MTKYSEMFDTKMLIKSVNASSTVRLLGQLAILAYRQRAVTTAHLVTLKSKF